MEPTAFSLQLCKKIKRGDLMETAFKTDCGQVRDHNEDSGGVLTHESGMLLAIVADGMGGHRAGDVASTLALDFVVEKWKKAKPEQVQSEEASRQWLTETIQAANTYILSHTKKHPECQGMGTTIVVALCSHQFLTLAHVGDSRGYLLGSQDFDQVTQDHSLVNELVRQGEISKEEAASHPRKNVILQALGTENEVFSEPETLFWDQEDILLLCSDGLTDNLNHEQLETVLRSETSVSEKAEKLTELANLAGGNDNITLAIVKLTEEKNSEDELSRAAANLNVSFHKEDDFSTKECR